MTDPTPSTVARIMAMTDSEIEEMIAQSGMSPEEFHAMVERRVAEDARRREYVAQLVEAAGGDLSTSWGEAAARLAEGTDPNVEEAAEADRRGQTR